MGETLRFIQALRRTSTFEAAAEHLVRHLASVVESRLLDAEISGGFLQLHIRHAERAVLVGDCEQVSATLRQAATQGSALLAVQNNALFTADDQFTTASPVQETSFESRSLLTARGVAYVLGIPLTYDSDAVVGVIGLEIRLSAAPPASLARVIDTLTTRASLALDVLYARPREPSAPQAEAGHALPAMSPPLADLLADLKPFAATAEPLLLCGPPGLGQIEVAGWCHAHAERPDGLTVARFDLAGADAGLELFGWVTPPRGAPPGPHRGLLGEARQGTLFIPAVDRLARPIQARLVDAMQSGRYRPLGESRERRARARIIFGLSDHAVGESLHPALWRMISWARFTLPPLDKRADELGDWARHFLDAAHTDRSAVDLAPDVVPLLQRRRWPENLASVDELMRRALVIAKGEGREPLVVRAWHVQRALGDRSAEGSPLRVAMREAAGLFIDAVEAHRPALTLKHARLFEHDVELAAVARHGKADGYRLLGHGKAVDSDNHHRKATKATQRIADLDALLLGGDA